MNFKFKTDKDFFQFRKHINYKFFSLCNEFLLYLNKNSIISQYKWSEFEKIMDFTFHNIDNNEKVMYINIIRTLISNKKSLINCEENFDKKDFKKFILNEKILDFISYDIRFIKEKPFKIINGFILYGNIENEEFLPKSMF